jgi:hypothetical protein
MEVLLSCASVISPWLMYRWTIAALQRESTTVRINPTLQAQAAQRAPHPAYLDGGRRT